MEIEIYDFDGDIPTKSWLMSLGFREAESDMGPNYANDLVLGRLRLNEYQDGDSVWVMNDADWFEMKTKSQVLALLIATSTMIQPPTP